MKRSIAILVLAILAASGAVRIVRAQDKEEPLDPRILKYDKGPAKIDVSKYPADMQKKYKVFEKKCSSCHSIARPINCDYVLDDEWERYIKRMMRKAGPSLISADDGKQIFEFLTYDSKTRKKAQFDKRTAEAAKEGR
jgi:cytochrome c5